MILIPFFASFYDQNVSIKHMQVACTRLDKSICLSVCLSVGPSCSKEMSLISTIRLFQRWRRSVMIKRALIEVYTALLLPLPKSTQLMMLCIRLVPSVGLSHQYKNMPNWYNKAVSTLKAISNITAQAQKPATDDAMYSLISLSKIYKQVFWNLLFLIVTSGFCGAFQIKY